MLAGPAPMSATRFPLFFVGFSHINRMLKDMVRSMALQAADLDRFSSGRVKHTHPPELLVGQTRARLLPRTFASSMFDLHSQIVAGYLFNESRYVIPVGQAVIQGASKQKRHRSASTLACCGVYAGSISDMLAASGWIERGLSGIL